MSITRNINIVEPITAGYDDVEAYQNMLDDLLENWNYTGEYRLSEDSEYRNPELLEIPSTIGEQKIFYSVEQAYKGGTESEVKMYAAGDNGEPTLLSEYMNESEAAQRYDGRLCISLNLGRMYSIGNYATMEDTGLQFAELMHFASITDVRIYWSNGTGALFKALSYPTTADSIIVDADGQTITGSFNATSPFGQSFGNAYKTANNDIQLKSLGFIFECNLPIFIHNESAEDYVLTGNKEECINDPEDFDDNIWYAINKVYKDVKAKRLDFKKSGYKFDIGKKRICFYRNKTATGSWNLTLKTTAEEFKILKRVFEDDKEDKWDTIWEEVTKLPQTKWLDGDAEPYFGDLDTNIPIYDSEEDADNYLGGKKPPKKRPGKDNPTGDDIDDTKLNPASYATFFTTYYLMELEEMEDLAAWLFTGTNIQVITEDNPCLWGAEPINMIIDTYWTPINLKQLCAPEGAMVTFGQIVTDQNTYKASQVVSPETVLFNQKVFGSYDDWRDYQYLKFRLMLPYYGLIDLDTGTVLNHMLKCTFKFYLASKTIKYYLYLDGVQIGCYEGAVGASFPISAMDMTGKANEKKSGIYGALEAAGTLSSTASGVANDVLSGGIPSPGKIFSGVVSGIEAYDNGLTAISRSAGIQITGNSAVDAATNDCTMAYLIIEEDLHIIPDRLNEIYNYPNYTMDTIGKYNGFVIANNIQIKSDLTASEVSELTSIIGNGIII